MIEPLLSSSAALAAPGTAPEAALVQRLAQGDKAALGALYFQLERPLYHVAFFILRDSAEAEDIVQDVFLLMWLKAEQFRATKGTVYAWAATLTRHRAIDCLRRRRRLTLILGDHPDQDFPCGEAPCIRSGADDSDDAQMVRQALLLLPKDERTVLHMAFLEGLSHLEIAGILGEPLGTIKSRSRRGLARLRLKLAEASEQCSLEIPREPLSTPRAERSGGRLRRTPSLLLPPLTAAGSGGGA